MHLYCILTILVFITIVFGCVVEAAHGAFVNQVSRLLWIIDCAYSGALSLYSWHIMYSRLVVGVCIIRIDEYDIIRNIMFHNTYQLSGSVHSYNVTTNHGEESTSTHNLVELTFDNGETFSNI